MTATPGQSQRAWPVSRRDGANKQREGGIEGQQRCYQGCIAELQGLGRGERREEIQETRCAYRQNIDRVYSWEKAKNAAAHHAWEAFNPQFPAVSRPSI
jgi:hypothetical protein